MLYDFKLRRCQELARNVVDNYPSWSPDGKCVYFNSADLVAAADKGSPEYRICLSDRKIERVADMAQAGQLAWGNAGFWAGLAPDGSILALRDLSIEEIYSLDVQLP
jgi:hypothetical protein